MQQILILPDVHGRAFYKPVLEDKESKIVFLGDYLDPYPNEGVSVEEAIANLEEILEFKKQNKDRVVLLLGNHDCGYIWPDVCESRRSYKYYNDIKAMFKNDMDLFDLAFEWKANKKRYLLSHAGVHKVWFDFVHDITSGKFPENYDNVANYLNNLLRIDDSKLSDFLGVYSYYRGWGGAPFGSCVWADVREWSDENNIKDDKVLPYYQIFGHTQLIKDPIIKDRFACIDCRKIFTLEEIENGKN